MYPNSRKRCDTLFSATTKVGKRRTERRMIQQTNGENYFFKGLYLHTERMGNTYDKELHLVYLYF